jgi:quercetin dioxygenase-like cupin family protein
MERLPHQNLLEEEIMKNIIMFAVLGTLASGSQAQQVVRAGSAKVTAGPAAWFTGRVAVRALTTPTAPGQAGTALVAFRAGARSHWHTHPAGQTLFLTEGCGWFQAAGSRVRRICQGDTVYVTPGVKHWHGATATTAMTHLAITEQRGGQNANWLEPVSAAQYRGPAR